MQNLDRIFDPRLGSSGNLKKTTKWNLNISLISPILKYSSSDFNNTYYHILKLNIFHIDHSQALQAVAILQAATNPILVYRPQRGEQ